MVVEFFEFLLEVVVTCPLLVGLIECHFEKRRHDDYRHLYKIFIDEGMLDINLLQKFAEVVNCFCCIQFLTLVIIVFDARNLRVGTVVLRLLVIRYIAALRFSTRVLGDVCNIALTALCIDILLFFSFALEVFFVQLDLNLPNNRRSKKLDTCILDFQV